MCRCPASRLKAVGSPCRLSVWVCDVGIMFVRQHLVDLLVSNQSSAGLSRAGDHVEHACTWWRTASVRLQLLNAPQASGVRQSLAD